MSFNYSPRTGITGHHYGGLDNRHRKVSPRSSEIKRFNKRKTVGIFPLVVKFRILNDFKMDEMHIGVSAARLC